MAYDVFISFKNTAPGGGLTVDRTIAERLHMMLRDEGLEVFFSEKDLSTTAFMNEIYRALEEAPLLILIGSSVDYIKSKWVMSEWQNFLGAMNIGKKPDGQIMTVLCDITNRDLPIELANFQSYDADNLDGAVDFAFKALGRVRKSEAAAWLAQEDARKRREAEEAAVLEAQKRLEMERQAERERKIRINAENRASKAQKSSRSMKIVAAVLAVVLLVGGAIGVGVYLKQQAQAKLMEIYSFERVDNGFAVTRYKGEGGDVVLPKEYSGHPVVEIGDSAFSGCSSLTSITLPDSVTSIDYFAFSGCSSLTSISIPDSVTSIGSFAFEGCYSLTSITLPDSVTSIDYFAFSGCSSLTSISIPNSVTSIGDSAFWGCSITVYAPHEASYYGYTPDEGVTWVVK